MYDGNIRGSGVKAELDILSWQHFCKFEIIPNKQWKKIFNIISKTYSDREQISGCQWLG